jgi:hypothetical protein
MPILRQQAYQLVVAFAGQIGLYAASVPGARQPVFERSQFHNFAQVSSK